MRYIGRLRGKKTNVEIGVDNAINPTILVGGSTQRANETLAKRLNNGDLETISGQFPVFEMDFSIEGFETINSGARILIKDKETNAHYYMYNYDIGNMLEAMNKGSQNLSIRENKIDKGIFTVAKAGKFMSLRLLKESELDFINFE